MTHSRPKIGYLLACLTSALLVFQGLACGISDESTAKSQDKLVEAQKQRAESLKGEAGGLQARKTRKR
jgi:hypothetical protein